MLSTLEKVLFSFVILGTVAAFVYPVSLRLQILRRMKPEVRAGDLWRRLVDTAAKVLFQKCTLKDERAFTGFMHVFIFYGALTFDTMTVNHSLEGYFDKFYLFGNGAIGLLFSLAVDVFSVLVLVGVAFFIVRRFILRPKAYRTTLLDSGIIYILLITVTLSYLYFEAFAVTSHPE
ncbi:MAG: conserved rane protein of unknown function, partial [Candidatus Aminicenantes bacterium]|nr:conserved rane protein of unknown function [Candidatus Aminicenantes bacterium]